MKPSPFDRIGSLLTEDFLNVLSEAFPHRCPNPQDSEREVWMKAGERRLVDILQAKYEETLEQSHPNSKE